MTRQPTLAEGVLPYADEVMALAREAANEEGARLWSLRHHELIRQEWLRAYPDCDETSREILDEAVARAAGHPHTTDNQGGR